MPFLKIDMRYQGPLALGPKAGAVFSDWWHRDVNCFTHCSGVGVKEQLGTRPKGGGN